MPKPKIVPVTVKLPHEIAADYKRRAREAGMTRHAFVRELLVQVRDGWKAAEAASAAS